MLVISSAMALVALLVAGMAVWQTRNQPQDAPPTPVPQVVHLPTVTAIPTHSFITPTAVGTQLPALVMSGRIIGPRGANLRTGPGTRYQVIGALNYNTPIRLLYRTEDASWVEIESWNLMLGWVSTSLVEADGDIMQLAIMPMDEVTPISSATPTSETPTGVAGSVNTGSGSNGAGNGANATPSGSPVATSTGTVTVTPTETPTPTDLYTATPTDLPTETPLPTDPPPTQSTGNGGTGGTSGGGSGTGGTHGGGTGGTHGGGTGGTNGGGGGTGGTNGNGGTGNGTPP
jgi:hypothetical protein